METSFSLILLYIDPLVFAETLVVASGQGGINEGSIDDGDEMIDSTTDVAVMFIGSRYT